MSQSGTVFLVDDDPAVLLAGAQALELAGFAVRPFNRPEPVLEQLSQNWNGVLITDVKMPRIDGMTVLRRALEVDPDLPVVVVTGHGDVAMAVAAMRAGAYDFLEKPLAAEQLSDVAARALEKRRLVLENRALRRELDGSAGIEAVLIGKSGPMERLRDSIQVLAPADADVLITGETGSGKELVARALHDRGPRAAAPFVAINCGALPAEIIESELFGHEAGAFTGAREKRIGRFEHAAGGTIFLDEIESMPLALQVKLLRVLQERSIQRLGSNREVALDIRVLAATKEDLQRASAAGRFRADLFYRLGVVSLDVPPLRRRGADVPLLFHHFLARAAQRLRRPAPPVSPAVASELLAHAWPGNVRELQNAAERFTLGLGLGLAPAAPEADPAGPSRLAERVDAFEKNLIGQELARQKGNVSATCAALKVPRKTLYEKMQKHGLSREDYLESQREPSAG